MNHTLYTLFKHDLKKEGDQTQLLEKIFSNIDKERAKAIRTQKILWSSTSFAFLIITIITGWHAVSGIIYSDTGSYLSLVFSDTSQALTIWKELAMSIVESLPIIGIGLFLASVYLLFWSTRKYSIRSRTLAY